MTVAFEFEQVCVEAGDAMILRNVTATVLAGAVTVLLGPSGAGKTTLLRLCNRLEVPTSGVVRYHGDDIAGLDPLALRRRVGMVFQRPTLFAGTVRDNLRTALPDGDDDTFVEALEQAALNESFLHRDGGDLSGGEAQRACVARSLLPRPDVLLMDEPTSSLDQVNTKLLESNATELVAAGVTVVWVTHDLAQAERISDHTIELEGGRIVA